MLADGGHRGRRGGVPACSCDCAGCGDPGAARSRHQSRRLLCWSELLGSGHELRAVLHRARRRCVTSWSHRANSATGRELGLRIFRWESGTNYKLVGGSGVQTLTASTVNTFDTRIGVKAGDVLGLYVGNPGVVFPIDLGGGASCAYTSSGSTTRYTFPVNPEPSDGSSVNLVGSLGSTLLNVTARLEADADGDGFGDETQDGCPTVAGTSGGCSSTTSPNPTTGPPADKTPPTGKINTSSDSIKDGSITVSFTSSEAGTAAVSGTINVPQRFEGLPAEEEDRQRQAERAREGEAEALQEGT